MYFFYCLRSDVYFIIYMAICTASLAVWNYKKTCHTCFLITRHWSRRWSCIQTWLKIVAMEEHLTGGLQLLHTLKSNMTMDRLPVSQQWCSPYIGVRRLDQRRIDNKLSRMYKITHNLIAIPISDFLIPRVRPSRHYHPLPDNCYDWLLQFFILYKSCISLEQPPPWNCGLLHLGTVQPSSLQDWPRLTIENQHTFTFKPNLYSHLF